MFLQFLRPAHFLHQGIQGWSVQRPDFNVACVLGDGDLVPVHARLDRDHVAYSDTLRLDQRERTGRAARQHQ